MESTGKSEFSSNKRSIDGYVFVQSGLKVIEGTSRGEVVSENHLVYQ